jgi:hypothetical protein
MVVWYSLWQFGIFSPVLVWCTKKNLATLCQTAMLSLIFPEPFGQNPSDFCLFSAIFTVLPCPAPLVFVWWSVRTWVARWYIFKPKIPILVNFVGSCNGRWWYILRPFGLSYGHLLFFWPFGKFYGHLVHFPRFGILYQEKSGNPGSIIVGGLLRGYLMALKYRSRQAFKLWLSLALIYKLISRKSRAARNGAINFMRILWPTSRIWLKLISFNNNIVEKYEQYIFQYYCY